MNKRTPTSQQNCLLIGEDYFLVECAEILLINNYNIIGLISSEKNIELWALKNNISLYKSINEISTDIIEIDYLFSIVNSKIIPENFLKKIKKLSINYHHAPLPKYAGINAPSWAIINNEKQHGISWHIMNTEIDSGDILKQSIFDLDENETALSLNLKCYQNALNAFKELITELTAGSFSLTQQSIDKRTYYGLSNKPKCNGWIDWRDSAEQIDTYYRAFHFGVHDNSLSTLKFNINSNIYIINELKLSTLESQSLPGTIINLTDECLEIATSTKNIIITQIITLDGHDCVLNDLYKAHNLHKGSKIKPPTYNDLHIFEKLSIEICKYEKYWVNEIDQFNPAEFPFLTQKSQDILISHKSNYKTVAKINLPSEQIIKLKNKYKNNNELVSFFIAGLFIYLYKLGNTDKFGIGLISSFHANKSHLFSQELPFSIGLTNDVSVADLHANIYQQLLKIQNKKTFLNDIFCRYQAAKNSEKFPVLSIGFDATTALYNKNKAFILFNISLDKNEISVLVNKNLHAQNKHFLWFVKNSLTHYTLCLKNILTDTCLLVKQVSIIPEKEKQLVFQKWNDTKKKIPRKKTTFELLKKSFHKNSDQTAIHYQNTKLTYQTLETQVTNFAGYLHHNMQIREQTPVIVFLSRSIEWIVSLLGLTKTNAIYIPVPTNTPIERLRSIIKDTKAEYIITNDKYAKKICSQFPETKLIFPFSSCNKEFKPKYHSDDIAYIMYTSGSTGAPKGVMIQHHALINLVVEQIKSLQINPAMKILQFSSIGFDASIWEVFATLIAGGSIYIPSEEKILVGNDLANLLINHKITCVTLPPSILQTISPTKLQALKTIIIAGEPCSKELIDIWVEKVTLINAYGPTEATVCATMMNLSGKKQVSIGKPIANTHSYVLDHNYQPLPIGVTGELYLGGENLALGYLNKPELTKKYFIKHPFTQEKIYRTRDLARWLPDGHLEYIGRVDNQIKIRGFRIELEAIETQILHNKNVKQAAVICKKHEYLGDILVAYVVIKKQIELGHLRYYLAKHLPYYMIPNFFVCLDILPLTNNGKIDRSSLPEPEVTRSNKQHTKTDLEVKIEKIWSKIFKIESIDPYDSFFTLGGNSLLLSQLLLALRDELSFDLHFSIFLKNPTISGIAQIISQKFHNILEYDTQIFEDIILDKTIYPENTNITKSRNKNVFLTGCTGFLGVHILENLVQDEKIDKIYCLVRADNNEAAFEKIKAAVSSCKLNFVINQKIVPLIGDLSLPYFGLNNETYQFLTKKIDIIYHNGAYVNHLYDYSLLRATNVCATVEILKLAGTYKNKHLHYISTLSAVGGFTKNDHHILEEFISLDYDTPPNDGYSQTKWVSEKLLSEASNRNFSINIYRPGWIFGNTHTGYFPIAGNHLLLLIKSCIQMKVAPNWNIKLNILPVDFVSEFIVKTSEYNSVNTVYNLANANQISWTNIVDNLNQFGHQVTMISPEKWTNKIQKIDEKNALFSLLPLYIGYENTWDKSLNKLSEASCSNTLNALSALKTNYPEIDQNTLRQCFSAINENDNPTHQLITN